MTRVADFNSDLKFARDPLVLLELEGLYRRFYGERLARVVRYDHDMAKQALGIDSEAVMLDGSVSSHDDKPRRRNQRGQVFNDILIEHTSNMDTKSPGWIYHAPTFDWIVYPILPLGICYFLPFAALQAAWLANEHRWRRNRLFPQALAPNGTMGAQWFTASSCIPPEEVFKHVPGCSLLRFGPWSDNGGWGHL